MELEIQGPTFHVSGRLLSSKCDGCKGEDSRRGTGLQHLGEQGKVSLSWGGGGVNGGSSAPRYLSPSSLLLRPGLIPGSKKGHRKVLLKTDSKVPTLQKD